MKTPPLDPSPPPPPSKHGKSKVIEKDANYSDDFEQVKLFISFFSFKKIFFLQNYDDDFDDEPIPPPTVKVITNIQYRIIFKIYFQKSTSSRREEKSRSTDDDLNIHLSKQLPQTKYYPSSNDRDNIQVYTSSRRFHSHDLSDRIQRRYKDLSRLIELDRQSFHILDMTPMPAHAAYMRDIRLNNKKSQLSDNDDGTSWTSSVKTQTNDDAENVQSQTDEIDIRSMWTQHPSENEHTACGSGNTNNEKQFSDENKIRENEDLLRMLRLETDLGRYQTFIINSGKVEK